MKKGRKTVYSLLAFVTIGGLAFGDFATSKGVAPEISSAELTQEHRETINALHKDKQEDEQDEQDKEEQDKEEQDKEEQESESNETGYEE